MSKKSSRHRSRPATAPGGPLPPATPVQAPEGPVRIRASREALEEEQEVLFVIEREETDEHGQVVLIEEEYTIPKRVRPNFAIRFLNEVYRDGDLVAVAGAMHSLLGADTMDALAESPHVTEEHMSQIMAAIQHKMSGAANTLMRNF